MIGDRPGSITVAVRVRPPTSWETARLPEPCYDTTIRTDGALSTPGSVQNASFLRDIVQVIDDRILTFDPQDKDRVRSFMERGFMPPGTKRYKDRRFMFDKVFNHESMQQDVYDTTAEPLLKPLLDGYNATVFAYGATGCGKTHTISGTEGDPGVIYLTMADLFQRIEDRKDEYNIEVMVTFLEIYNEEIRDLLAEPGSAPPRGGLAIREDKSVKVVGLTEIRPNTAEEVKEIVILGNTRRTQSPTYANATSSRSHAVLQVHVTQSPRTANVTEQRTMATLSIIDLAGSERAAATMNMGKRMVEGANINKSLLALGNCINALCESGGAIRHVPYRNSKLTRLLKFSLGGNCKTVMIVCVAPTSNHFDDTHNTLIYAERATKIKTRVVTRNVVNVDRHVGQYVEAINRLNIEVEQLKRKLEGKTTTELDIARRKRVEAEQEVERARKDMDAKMKQTTGSMVDGASCSGLMTVASLKVAATRSRLSQIEASPFITADMEAERALLQSFISADEAALQQNSNLTIRAQRASNSQAMFDATIRAVSERRLDRLDEASVEIVKLDARWRKAEIEKLKAEEERDVMKGALENMTSVVVNLVGMLGRSTTMVGDSAAVLNNSGGDEESESSDHVRKVATLLSSIKEKNDEAFLSIVGMSTAEYTMAGISVDLDRLHGYGAEPSTYLHPGMAAQKKSSSSKTRTRRSTAYQQVASSATPIRSPRRSTRASLASQPYRRVHDKEKKSSLKKSVQWRDEAGQGNLVEGNLSINVIPAADTSSISCGRGTPNSKAGSESEWEDEIERTDDDSVDVFSSSLPPSTRPRESLNSAKRYGSLGSSTKRPRASHLKPAFLKARSNSSSLGSVVERDENSMESPRRGGGSRPLGDRNMNSSEMESMFGSSASPGKRSGGMNRSSSGPPRSGGSRRKSGMGVDRGTRARRRSSQIPQISPNGSTMVEAKARRVMFASPAKKVKRMSFARLAHMRVGGGGGGGNSSFDTSVGDISSAGRSKPTWR